jgi:hypothetical protein
MEGNFNIYLFNLFIFVFKHYSEISLYEHNAHENVLVIQSHQIQGLIELINFIT